MPWHVVVAAGGQKVAGRTAGGATEFGSHLPTWWMCRPWKPGVSLPTPVVAIVTVA